MAAHLRMAEYKPILLVGGATGRVGDPSFRDSAKNRLDDTLVDDNVNRITKQLDLLMNNGASHIQKLGNTLNSLPEVRIFNNLDWQKDLNLLNFLDQVGRNVRLSTMLRRDSVQRRLQAENGMTFTEFTYQLLQGYDYYHLHRYYQCVLQVGGSDQWGNMLSGVDLVSKLNNDKVGVSAMTFPLLTTSNGEKMGKSSGNAIWLDPTMTSPFDLYQYFVQLPDKDATTLLPLLTFIPMEEISMFTVGDIQKSLAYNVCAFVHGALEADQAVKASKLLFEEYESDLFTSIENQDILAKILKGSQRYLSIDENRNLRQALKTLMPQTSFSSLTTLAKSGGIYVNGQRTEDMYQPIQGGRTFLRIGKHLHFLVENQNITNSINT